MTKRISSVVAASAVVFALMVPAFASAAPEVTVGGTRAAIGTSITLTSTNTVQQTSLGKLTCTHIIITGKITGNTGSKVAAEGTGAGSSTGCKLGEKEILTTDITLQSLTSTASGSGTMSLTFVADLPNSIVCHFSAAAAPFTYSATTDVIKLTNADFVSTPAACEPGLHSGEFTVTSPGGAVVLH